MIQQLAFASCYVYSPRGDSPVSQASRTLRDRFKAADPTAFYLAARRTMIFDSSGVFPAFFGLDVTLVPVPGRAPRRAGHVDRTENICDALIRAGLARDVVRLIDRIRPVPKSAFAMPGERPTPQVHFESLAAIPTLVSPAALLLVDDVVTRGATLLACASRLAEGFPGIPIRGFALLRTESYAEIDTTRQPVVGTIELLADGQTIRRP